MNVSSMCGAERSIGGSILAHVAYFAGLNTDKPLKHKALVDLILSLMWGGLAYWQCGKSWLLFGIALLGCYARFNRILGR